MSEKCVLGKWLIEEPYALIGHVRFCEGLLRLEPLIAKQYMMKGCEKVETKSTRRIIMTTAKLFENGRSQAVRLPKEYRFSGNEVSINKIGDVVILMPQDNKWAGFMESLELFTDDFMKDGREQPENQEREIL